MLGQQSKGTEKKGKKVEKRGQGDEMGQGQKNERKSRNDCGEIGHVVSLETVENRGTRQI